jgi:hypothetical protein
MIDVIVYCLLGLNVVQFLFWGLVTKNLVDRLMSRNYADYVSATKPPPSQTVKLLDPEIIEEQDVLNELNGIMRS